MNLRGCSYSDWSALVEGEHFGRTEKDHAMLQRVYPPRLVSLRGLIGSDAGELDQLPLGCEVEAIEAIAIAIFQRSLFEAAVFYI